MIRCLLPGLFGAFIKIIPVVAVSKLGVRYSCA